MARTVRGATIKNGILRVLVPLRNLLLGPVIVAAGAMLAAMIIVVGLCIAVLLSPLVLLAHSILRTFNRQGIIVKTDAGKRLCLTRDMLTKSSSKVTGCT